MHIFSLEEIFTPRFSKKTKSTIKNVDIEDIIHLYVDEHLPFHEIGNKYNTHRRVIKEIVKKCLTNDEYKLSKHLVISLSVNDPDRKKQQIDTWKERYPNWEPPFIRNPSCIEKMIVSRKKNTNFNPRNNLGDLSGKKNGRYIFVYEPIKDLIVEYFLQNMSIHEIVNRVGYSIGKVFETLLEKEVISLEQIRAYYKRQTKSEAYFEQLCRDAKITCQFQHTLYFF